MLCVTDIVRFHKTMFDILQLKSKSLDELQAIAKEMGIKTKDDKNQLVYDILDEQAISAAKNKPEKERRDRKKVTRKNGPEKVYTADENGNAKSMEKKEKKEEKPQEENAPAAQSKKKRSRGGNQDKPRAEQEAPVAQQPVQEPVQEQPAVEPVQKEELPQPAPKADASKRRGRPRKQQVEVPLPEIDDENVTLEVTDSYEQEEEPVRQVAEQPVRMQEPEQMPVQEQQQEQPRQEQFQQRQQNGQPNNQRQ